MKGYFLFMKKILFLLLAICAIAPVQADWLSSFTGWCSDNKQVVAGAGIIAGGIFANQILKACTTEKSCHFLAVKEAYTNRDQYSENGYKCYPVKQTTHKNGDETYEILINPSNYNPFHYYVARTYTGKRNKDFDYSKDSKHKEFKPFV